LSNEKFKLVCTACGAKQKQSYRPFCEKCQQMNDILYDLDKVEFKSSDNPYVRFFDLLPVKKLSLLPDDATFTPTIHAKNLGKFLHMPEIYLKNETVLRTGSTKYRMAAVSLAYLYESGVRHFCTSSTGNSSTAYAQMISRMPDLEMSLFTSSDFTKRVNYEPTNQIKHYIVNQGSFVDAFQCAADFAKKYNYVSEQGFFNPGRREGLKLTFLEAAEQINKPIDWYVQAVSSAMGVYGTYKGAKELLQLGKIKQLPHLLCVQQESCAPMVKAWQDQSKTILSKHIIPRPQGIASAILRGNPTRTYPYMRTIVKESQGTFQEVSEKEIREAQRHIKELENIDICFSASAAVAGLIKAAQNGTIDQNARILINLTGRDRSEEASSDKHHNLDKIDGQWVLRN